MLIHTNALQISCQLENKAKDILAVMPAIRRSAQNDNCDMLCIDKAVKNAYEMLRTAQNLKCYAHLHGSVVYKSAVCITSTVKAFLHDACIVCNNVDFEIVLPNENLYTLANSEMFCVCFANIICNSVIYSSDNAKVKVCVYKTNEFAAISVSDNAKGIKPDLLKHMYGAFVSQDPYDDSLPAENLGLGLAVVQGFANSFGGKLIAESRQGVGSSIALLLPLCKSGERVFDAKHEPNAVNNTCEPCATYAPNKTDFLHDKYSVLYTQFCSFCKLPV